MNFVKIFNMAEEVVIPEAEKKVQENIEAAAEQAAAIEENFGSKEKATEIRTKAKKKPADKTEEQPLNKEKEVPAKTIITEEGDDLKQKEVKADKKDDKFFDPFDEKPADKEIKKDKDGKDIKEEKPITAVEKSKEDLERDAQFPQLKEFHDKYKAVVENPLITAIVESGKDVITALRELQPMDYSIKSDNPEEQEGVERWRAKEYFSKIEGLKDKDLTDSVDEYMSLEGYQKRRETNAQITALNNKQNERVQQFTQESTAAKERRSNQLTKFNNDIGSFIATVKKEKNLFGMQLADDKIETLETGIKNFFLELWDKDGNVNLKPIVNAVYFEKFNKEAMKEKLKKVESKTTEKVLEDVIQLDDNNQSITNRKPKTDDDLERLIDEKFSGKAI